MGSGELLDQLRVQDHDNRKVSVGLAVKVMVPNGLGFVNHRLYLVPHFFANKPTDRLVGPAIKAAHLNDEVLGCALDSLFEQDVTALYRPLAHPAAQRLGLEVQDVQLDQAWS